MPMNSNDAAHATDRLRKSLEGRLDRIVTALEAQAVPAQLQPSEPAPAASQVHVHLSESPLGLGIWDVYVIGPGGRYVTVHGNADGFVVHHHESATPAFMVSPAMAPAAAEVFAALAKAMASIEVGA